MMPILEKQFVKLEWNKGKDKIEKERDIERKKDMYKDESERDRKKRLTNRKTEIRQIGGPSLYNTYA